MKTTDLTNAIRQLRSVQYQYIHGLASCSYLLKWLKPLIILYEGNTGSAIKNMKYNVYILLLLKVKLTAVSSYNWLIIPARWKLYLPSPLYITAVSVVYVMISEY